MAHSRERSPTPEQWVRTFQADSFSLQASNEWYGVADADDRLVRAKAKADFLADDSLRAPQFEYRKLRDIDFRASEKSYQQLLQDAEAIDDLPLSETMYEQAARKLAELYRHKEVLRRLGGVTNTALSQERASIMTQELFGAPERDDFAHLLMAMREKASTVQEHSEEARELLRLTREVSPESPLPEYELRDSTLKMFKHDLNKLFPGFDDILQQAPESDLTPEISIAYMQQVLDFIGLDEAGWQAKLVDGGVAASTSEADRTISIGRERAAKFTPEGLRKTTIHESFGHALRAFLASQQTDPAKRQAQAGNLVFEEGFATGLEQVVTGEKRIAGVQYYISLGLQLGLDQDGKKRDFRDTFEILWRRIVVDNLVEGKDPGIEKARETAYLQCLRTNRGGALDARDISYFLGAKKAYAWMNEVAQIEDDDERLAALSAAFSGRFDPTNPEQAAMFNDDKETRKQESV